MKTKLLLTAALGVAVGALLAVVLTQPAFAAGNIFTATDNPHNLSSSAVLNTVVSDVTRKCDYCHTPHGAADAVSSPTIGAFLPLWNRNDAANGGYVFYNDPNNTIDAVDIDATLGAQSMACMSCHDGTIELDDLINRPNPYPLDLDMDFPDVINRVTGELLDANNVRTLGTDLQNDHPVSFTNPGFAGDPDLDPLGVLTDPYHFGVGEDQVECASCHQVHYWSAVADEQPFLRLTMADDALCNICHDK